MTRDKWRFRGSWPLPKGGRAVRARPPVVPPARVDLRHHQPLQSALRRLLLYKGENSSRRKLPTRGLAAADGRAGARDHLRRPGRRRALTLAPDVHRGLPRRRPLGCVATDGAWSRSGWVGLHASPCGAPTRPAPACAACAACSAGRSGVAGRSASGVRLHLHPRVRRRGRRGRGDPWQPQTRGGRSTCSRPR